MERPARRSAKTWLFILAIAAMAGTMSISAARADDAQAKTLFKAMSDYLAAQQAISFDFDFNSRGRHGSRPEVGAGKLRNIDTQSA